jgi:hypothetical protein
MGVPARSGPRCGRAGVKSRQYGARGGFGRWRFRECVLQQHLGDWAAVWGGGR